MTEDDRQEPVQLVPVWSGSAYARARFVVPATWRRTITNIKLMFGTVAAPKPGDKGAPPSGLQSPTGLAAGGSFVGTGESGGPQAYLIGHGEESDGSGGKWVLLSQRTSTQPYQIGLPGQQFSVTEISDIATYEWATKPHGGGMVYSQVGGGAVG
jgi:hypothetical protein